MVYIVNVIKFIFNIAYVQTTKKVLSNIAFFTFREKAILFFYS